MKERIYTIPLTEVIVAGRGCPFCRLAARAEEALLRVYLEGMLVDVGWRGRVLEKWLCRHHLAGMQGQARKLGGALVTQALLRKALEILADHTGNACLPDWGSSCVACQDMDRTLLHHADAFISTWFAEPDFRSLAAKADPFCLPHLALIYHQTSRVSRRERVSLRAELSRLEEEALRPLLAEVDWFVRKFDARFQDAPWQGAEDAVERAVAVVAGSTKNTKGHAV